MIRRSHVAMVVLLIFVQGLSYAQASPASPAGAKGAHAGQSYTSERILARGRNATPVGDLGVRTYRIERIEAPQDNFAYAFHFIVEMDKVDVGPYTIWIDDVPYYASPIGNHAVAFRCYSQKPYPAFPEGAAISVSVGESCYVESESKLPERLLLPEKLRAPELQPNWVTLKTIKRSAWLKGEAGVEIKLKWPAVEARNAGPRLRIAKEEFFAGGEHINVLGFSGFVFLVPMEAFARLEDGAPISIAYGACGQGDTISFGKLNRLTLDRPEEPQVGSR